MASTSGTHSALFCDTNVLVRILTADPPGQARSAARAVRRATDRGQPLILTDVIFAELAYVLEGVYSLPIRDVARRLRRILGYPGITVGDDQMLRDTAAILEQGRLDLADAHLAALCRRTEDTAVLSFDRDFDRVDGVARVDPSTLARKA